MIPYEGREPYIFISYAHKDSEVVLPIIEAMADYGFRIWYDAGIEAGTEWPEYIAERLDGATAVITFLSDHALKSVNCRQEINEAISLEKDLLVVYLHELELTKGMRMRLSLTQAMFMHRHDSVDGFRKALFNAKILRPCLSEREQAAAQPVQPVVQETVFSNAAVVQEPSQVMLPEVNEPEVAVASDPEDFVIQDDGSLVRYIGNGGIVLIPECTKKIGLDEHGSGLYSLLGPEITYAFKKNNEITEVIIPEGVEYIGHMAFYGCENLVRVTLPKSLKGIEAYAFMNCYSLREVEIPGDSKLEVIGERAFENCSSLEKISFSKTLLRIEKDAFRACRSLNSFRIPLDGVLGIVREDTFHNCSSLGEVTLPNSVKTIESRAFYGCESLWDINFPKALKGIGERAFGSCEKLEVIDCGWHGALESVGREAFLDCKSLKTVNLSSTLKTIDEDAFTGCVSLGRVELPKRTKMPMFKQVFPKHTVVKRT